MTPGDPTARLDPFEQAELEVVRLALAGGWLGRDALREALLLREELRAQGRPARLIDLLAARVAPERRPALRGAYARALAGLRAPPPAPAADPPGWAERSRLLLGRAAGDDPPSVKAALARAGDTTKRLPPGAPPLAPPELTDTLHEPPPPGAAPAPRRTLGGHELLGELGRGGMGVVYRARDPRLGREVALKVINSAAADPEELARFEREARAAARVRHPGVVAVYGAGVDDGRPWLSLQLVEGESLRARLLRDGPLGFARAAEVAEAVGRALQAAHDACVLHRDVKPHNVLLTTEGQPLLTDFGLARAVEPEDGLTVTGQVIGTPAYMSPEQAEGDQTRVDARTDVYGLGATLYEMLTGQPPFQGASALQVLARVLEQEPTPPSRLRADLPRDLETICLACLAKAPEARYAAAGAVADDLRRFLEHRPIVARRAGPLARARLWARRHRRPLRALALVAAATLPFAAWQHARRSAAALELALAGPWPPPRAVPADELDRLDELVALSQGLGPRDAAALWLRRAQARALAGRDAEAVDDLGRSIALSPDPAAHALRAQVRDRLQHDPMHVLIDADAALALGATGEDRRQALRVKATTLGALEDRSGAEEAAEALISAAPDTPDGYRLRAALRTQERRFREVLADLDRVVELTHGDAHARARCDRGLVRTYLGDRAGAEEDLARALALGPTDVPTVTGCGVLLLQLGRVREADEHLERFEALQPAARVPPADRAELLVSRARVRVAAGRPADALADADDALVVASLLIVPRIQQVRAEALHRLRRFTEAGRAVQSVIARQGSPDAHTLRARLRNRMGDLAGALEDADRVLAYTPGEGRALAERALALLGLDDLPGAVRDAEAAARHRPEHARAWAVQALVRLAQGALSAAEGDARRALALDDEVDEAHLALGLALAHQGRGDEALPALERAAALLGPGHPLAEPAELALRALRGGR
ncbi:MAG: protein kinase [Planctomycetes bacterium]|nr:protein kinase [Planctomycetota bacterium]